MAIGRRVGIESTITTQGRLLCTQRFEAAYESDWPVTPVCLSPHRITGFTPVRRSSINSRRNAIGVPQIRVSTAIGSVFHAIETRPKALTPSTHPKLGVRSKHQRLHRCALERIFRPVLENSRLTRNTASHIPSGGKSRRSAAVQHKIRQQMLHVFA